MDISNNILTADVEALIAALTHEEKAAMLAGTRFMETVPVPRLGIPRLVMADGPHGLRKQIGVADNGVGRSEPATAFPTAAAIACSWNPELARQMGAAIAAECRRYGVHVLLGPGVNIKRNPLGGRNFEYYSEDPLLSGAFGSAFVQGVQSGGVGATVKHFAANNAENFRFMGESFVDERTLREIYFPAFRQVVRQGRPAAVMCAYNRIWGDHCSENRRLLTGVLREEWGFDGLTMTDWGATNDRVKGVAAGMDLEMPGDTPHCRQAVLAAMKDGTLPMSAVDSAIRNLLRLVSRVAANGAVALEKGFDVERHHELAGRLATQSAVLLKNEGVLPLSPKRKLLFVGDLFRRMRYQGSGSSMIHPARVTTPQEAMDARGLPYRFAQGYTEAAQEPEPDLLHAMQTEIDRADVLVFFGGLTDDAESEGNDRKDMSLPANQLAVAAQLVKSGKPLVVVLFGGSPMALPFADSAQAILYMALPGQNGGDATAALLLGEANPCGKLTETWPRQYADVPFGDRFSSGKVEAYRESVFVGYRYYTTVKRHVRFPFGHGMSYTRFSYGNPVMHREQDQILVSCEVKNEGSREGTEVVQLYVDNAASVVPRPLRELRAFGRITLKPGETGTVTLAFARQALAWYHVASQAWMLENGTYKIQIGASSEDIRLEYPLTIEDGAPVASPYPQQVTDAYRLFAQGSADIVSAAGTPVGEGPLIHASEHNALEHNALESNASESRVPNGVVCAANKSISDEVFAALLGRPLPQEPSKKPLGMESLLSDFRETFMGRILFAALMTLPGRQRRQAQHLPAGPERDNRLKGAWFLERVLATNSPRSLVMTSGGKMPYHVAQGLVALANGHPLTAFRQFLFPRNL